MVSHGIELNTDGITSLDVDTVLSDEHRVQWRSGRRNATMIKQCSNWRGFCTKTITLVSLFSQLNKYMNTAAVCQIKPIQMWCVKAAASGWFKLSHTDFCVLTSRQQQQQHVGHWVTCSTLHLVKVSAPESNNMFVWVWEGEGVTHQKSWRPRRHVASVFTEDEHRLFCQKRRRYIVDCEM